jgi:hypothetical protein
MKAKSFDRDPCWKGHNNRAVPTKLLTLMQDFGHSPTNFAGKEKGELGGRVQRAGKPAYNASRRPCS